MNKKMLTDQIARCFSDWDGDFILTIEEYDEEEEYLYFDVKIEHQHIGKPYLLVGRVSDKVELTYYDDGPWEAITQERMFTAMWFDAAEYRGDT